MTFKQLTVNFLAFLAFLFDKFPRYHAVTFIFVQMAQPPITTTSYVTAAMTIQEHRHVQVGRQVSRKV